MRTLKLSLALLAFLTFLLVGCKDASPSANGKPGADGTQGAVAEIPVISVDGAAKALQSGAVAVDANSDSTREENGTVPEAIILTSSYKYDLAQLPQDRSKELIFYCANTHCNASDSAAERASSNGYENVRVMREGIKGWKAAGKATTPFPKS